jgi:hypothetical protein
MKNKTLKTGLSTALSIGLLLTSNPQKDCFQEAKNGGSPGGINVTEEEKEACEKLPDIDVVDA